MKIKLLKHYGMSGPGDTLTNVNKPIADLLIRREIGVLVEPEKKVKKKAKKKCSNTK
jgi:hypothetical protein